MNLKILSKLIPLLMLAISLPTISHADIQGAPFEPEVDARFNALEGPSHISTNYPNFSADSVAVLHTAQATWDFAVQTGAIGTYDLGVKLPKNAIFVRSWLYSTTKPTTSASGTMGFYCQASGDIIATTTAAATYATAGMAFDGTSTGSASTFKYLDNLSTCDIHAVIATGALTAGKVTAYVEYVLHK